MVLVVALALAMMAPMAWGAPVPSQTACTTAGKADGSTAATERELIKAKLMGFGLSQQQAASRVALLTDAEVHAIATDLNAVMAAGANTLSWDTTTVLLLLILVVLIVHD